VFYTAFERLKNIEEALMEEQKEQRDSELRKGIRLLLSIVGALVLIFGAYHGFNFYVDNRIERAINHPDFLKKVADEIRIPFLIFDEKGTFHTVSGGATIYIDKIEPFQEKKRFSGFIVYPKEFLQNPPILQSINNDFQFTAPKRINTKDWKYRIPEFHGSEWVSPGQYDEPPAKLFKLEIIR
jgi:hypothetical protein